jgi:hypothetical protein
MNPILYLMTVPTNTMEWIPTVSLGDFDEFMDDYYNLFWHNGVNEADTIVTEVMTEFFQPHGTIIWRKKSERQMQIEHGIFI